VSEAPELHFERVLESAYDGAEAALRGGPRRWLPGYADAGGEITGELAYRQGSGRIRRRISIDAGPVQRFAYGVTVHVEWHGADHPELYPTLDGHLRLERRRPSGAVLRLAARYRPPGGRLGATADRAVMHRVAESSVEDFLDRVVKSLGG
jgi:hypothetical protein